jgi:hypothetical protein
LKVDTVLCENARRTLVHQAASLHLKNFNSFIF